MAAFAAALRCRSLAFARAGKAHGVFKVSQRPISIGCAKWQQSSEGSLPPFNPEENDRLIYEGILSTQIKLVKGFSLMTSIIGLSCQPVLLMQMQQSNANLAIMAGAGAFLSFFTFATPILIHWVSKKYVTELNYDKVTDTYTAITYSLFLRKKEVTFKLNDVQVPDIPGMFTTFRAKNVPLFVDGSQFYNPEHFGKIMGYDKPINLRWDTENDMTEAESKKLREKKE